MEQMHFVDDDEFHEFHVRSFTALAGYDVPLLWGRHDDVGLLNLLFGQMDITSELPDFDTEVLESFLEVADDFGDQGLHRCDVDDLELVEVVVYPRADGCALCRPHLTK